VPDLTSPGTAEQLEHGPVRDPWRPSRAQLLLVAAVVVVAGLVVWLRYARHEHALDVAAARSVSLSVAVASGGGVDGGFALQVGNEGAATVEVTQVRLDDGRRLVFNRGTTAPGGVVVGTLPTTACPARAGRATERVVTVDLRTSRGTTVTRRFTLAADGLALVNATDRARCGTQRPDEALRPQLRSATTAGRWVVATWDLQNASVLPVTVTGLSTPAGMLASPTRPAVTLLPAPSPSVTGTTTQLVLRLRITDCAAFDRAVYRGDTGSPVIRLALHGSLEDATGTLSLDSAPEQGSPVPGLFGNSPSLLNVLEGDSCPTLFFG
jgi:hypothetical protein